MKLNFRYLLVLLAAPAVLAVLLFEIGYRVHIWRKINEHVDTAAIWFQNQTIDKSAADDLMGINIETPEHGLFKKSTYFDLSVVYPQRGIMNFSVRTNNMGLLSDKEYTLARDPTQPEFRIVVLGESFTGPTTATYQWVDTLEDLLNDNPEIRAAAGGKRIRTYNLGWVGGGFQTFWKEWERSGKFFDPDMVLVNYTEIDFPRSDGPSLATEDRMIEHASEHMNRILGAHPNVLVTLMPTYNDLVRDAWDKVFSDYHLTKRLMKENEKVRVIMMRDLMPAADPAEILTWFNIPFDGHYSDRGGEIYARLLASLVAERISGKRIDFSDAPSIHRDKVMGENKPRTRLVGNSLSHISNNEETNRIIRETIRRQTRIGKIFSPHLYSWHFLTGWGSDGLHIPYTSELKRGFQPIAFGPGPDDQVFLNVVCWKEPIALTNSDCFHHLHMFVNTFRKN